MKLKQLFTSIFSTPKEKVENILKKCDIKNYVINDDLTVDVNGGVFLGSKSLQNLQQLPIKFGKVTGNFYCGKSQLRSLQGSPREVGGFFDCSFTNLASLKGAPRYVGGYFNCSHSKLISLQGAPREVGGDFYCSGNQLASLKGAPREVGGDFYCNDNQLTSLDGIGNVAGEIKRNLK